MVGRIFFDTSVLLAGSIELRDASDPAQKLMAAVAERRVRAVHTAWHCCLEFYAVATRLPEEFRLSPRDCLGLIEEEIFGRFRVHQLPAKIQRSFLRTAVEERVVGGRLYDAHIAEVARVAGAKMVITENPRHFSSLERHGVRVFGAGQSLAALLG
ncbi:MAG: type II toxin-antitoxin system VapC family toxin [Candidatus Binatia bacterium]